MCGSGTTAYATAEQWGRRWITGRHQPRGVALALARTRLMAGKFPYYLLADSPAGRKKALECGGLPPLSNTAEAEGGFSDASAQSVLQSLLKSESEPSHSKEADIRQGFAWAAGRRT